MKSAAITKQNSQVLPPGSRLWTPSNIGGGDLKLWMRPEGMRPHNGESTSVGDLRLNRWRDSSSFGSILGPFDEGSAFPSSIPMMKANLVSAGNGTTFGSLHERKFDTYRASNNGGGSIPDDEAPQIDPGTGAFTLLTVFRITRQDSASVPYDNDSMIIMSDGTEAIASQYILQVDVNSNTSSSPSFIKIKSVMGNDTFTKTLEEKSGLSQIFDNEEFLVAYERDGAANGFFYNNGSFIGSQVGQGADMSDNKPRNIHMKISAQVGGNFLASSDGSSHDIAEIVLINKRDATTRILCEGYLAHKYGRQNKLPSDHKYRHRPPRF